MKPRAVDVLIGRGFELSAARVAGRRRSRPSSAIDASRHDDPAVLEDARVALVALERAGH